MHRKFLLVFSLFLLAGCTIGQQNGNSFNLQAPPIIAGNHWQTAQYKAKNGDLVCTVSAGEMNVVLRGHGKTVAAQVETSSSINPGDYYRVIYEGDVHETPNGQPWFSPSESQAIIADLMKGGIVYTEIQQQFIQDAGGGYQRLGNKINLSGFGEEFKACEKFVKGS